MWESTAYLKTVAIAKIAHKGRLPRRYAPRNDVKREKRLFVVHARTCNGILLFFCDKHMRQPNFGF